MYDVTSYGCFLLCIRLFHALSVLLLRPVGYLFWINIDDLTISLSFQSLPHFVCFASLIEGAYNESRRLLILPADCYGTQ
jgi:hypothetical protein